MLLWFQILEKRCLRVALDPSKLSCWCPQITVVHVTVPVIFSIEQARNQEARDQDLTQDSWWVCISHIKSPTILSVDIIGRDLPYEIARKKKKNVVAHMKMISNYKAWLCIIVMTFIQLHFIIVKKSRDFSSKPVILTQALWWCRIN